MKQLNNRRPTSDVATGLRACGSPETDRQGRLSLPGVILLVCLIGLTGCHSAPPPAFEPLVARLYLEVPPGQSGARIQLPISGVTITVQEKPVFTEYDVRNAEVAQVELGRCLMLELTSAAARDLQRLSAARQGQRLVLFLNGAAVGARRLDQVIADGVILVFLETPENDLAAQVARLKRTSAEITAAAKK
jgi:hypothetical protein